MAASNARSISRPVTSLACRIRRFGMATFAPEIQLLPPLPFPLGKFHSQVDEFGDARRAFLDDRPNNILVAETGAGFERVAHVHLERIFFARDCGDAALGVVGVRFGARFLGDDGHATERRDFQCERKSRDAAAKNQKIKLFHLQSRIVDQPRFPKKDCQGHLRAASHDRDRLERFRVEKLNVIQFRFRPRANVGGNLRLKLLRRHRPVFHGRAGLVQSLVQDGRPGRAGLRSKIYSANSSPNHRLT